MSDWDFLHEMHDQGYSAENIADAAACGLAPWEHAALDNDWIDAQLGDEADDDTFAVEPFRSRDGFPLSVVEQAEILQDLIDCAQRHFANTGRYLQVWGELGEIYAEVRFGLRRHATHAPGSDGTINGKRVEVKTISPEKRGRHVYVKSQGDFDQLLIVRIDSNFQFRSKLLDRSSLKGSTGKFFRGDFKEDEDDCQ